MRLGVSATSMFWAAGAVCLLVLGGVLFNELTLPAATEQPPLPAVLEQLDQRLRAGEVVQVKNAVGEYLEQQPHVAAAHLLHGKALLAVGDFALSIDALRTAAALDPALEEAYVLLAQVNVQIGWADQALDALRDVLNVNNANMEALLLRADINARRQRGDLALEDIQFALSLEPNNMEALFARAQLYSLYNRRDLAIQDYQRVVVGDNFTLATNARERLRQLGQ